MIRPLLAVSRMTFADVTRQPAYFILALGAVLAQALSPALAMFGFEQDLGLMKEFSVSTVLLAGLCVVALGVSQVMERELESRTSQALLSKPVPRGVLLVGKFAGVVGALCPVIYLSLLVLLLAARQGPPQTIRQPWDWPVVVGGLGGAILTIIVALPLSLRSSKPFGQVAVKVGCVSMTLGFLVALPFDSGWSLQPVGGAIEAIDPLTVQAVFLAFLASVLLSTVALLLTLVVGRGASTGTILVFLLGLWLGGADYPWALGLPSLGVFWVGDLFYAAGTVLPWPYLLEATLYSLAYSSVCLLVGAALFNRKETG